MYISHLKHPLFICFKLLSHLYNQNNQKKSNCPSFKKDDPKILNQLKNLILD